MTKRRRLPRLDIGEALSLLAVAVLAQIISENVADALPEPVKVSLRVLVLAVGVVGLFGLFRRKKPPEPPEPPRPTVGSLTPPSRDLVGREDVVVDAVRAAREHGIVGVVGPRDVGTSAVASDVAGRLAADCDPGTEGSRGYQLDLRGRSTLSSEEPRVVASWLLEHFAGASDDR